jgi:hypothetical protein
MVAILISVLFATIISIIWVYFIDHAKEHLVDHSKVNNQSYRGLDFMFEYEKEHDVCSKHGKKLNGNVFCDDCLEESNI